MPPEYDPIRHTTSQAAAQGLEGAWLARLGFLAFGLGVIVASGSARWWGDLGRCLHLIFGMLMIAAAAFSTRHWDERVPFTVSEDLLHSVVATAMGFAFAFGVVAVAVGVKGRGLVSRAPDVAAVAASIAIPLLMGATPEIAGLLQRAMFAIAIAWYVLRNQRPAPRSGPPVQAR